MPDFENALPAASNFRSIPKYQHRCQFCNLEGPPAVALITINRNGRLQQGAFSQFGYVKGGDWILHDGADYDHWTTWCADCFYGKRPEILEAWYTANQARQAWMWFIAQVTEGSRLAMFQNQEATPEQEDQFLKIVNDEARRLHWPDAIPDGYKLQEVWQ